MHLYRLYTENVNYAETVELIASHFPEGFTLITGVGHYKGGNEHCLVVDIVTNDHNNVLNLAYAIKKHNKQKSVLIYCVVGEMKLVQ